jgi:hypothetical protein
MTPMATQAKRDECAHPGRHTVLACARSLGEQLAVWMTNLRQTCDNLRQAYDTRSY